MFNKVVLVGNLTRDIELRYAQSGSAIGSTGIAVTRKFSGANGEKREETCFIDITFFGRQAEIANQYLNKGSKVLVEGRLKFDQWQDQNGNNRSKHSITVESMEMLGSQTQGGFRDSHQDQTNSQYSNTSYSSNYQNHTGYQNDSNMNSGYRQQESFAQKAPKRAMNEQPYEEKIPEIDIDSDLPAQSQNRQNKPKQNIDVNIDDEEIPF
ncbi:single-stranded DNA-binding protein [Campylobacter fetus]|uniref:single-stranded DNA-binding protein n=1 Tax=Campylobacter fetus TaxID=196 RepID=UPI0003C2B5E4|nr:single-stranded DNA-binding protein [Campylobacter fetus]AGZ81968.1 single-stranded DNA binding protein [Campylobacter fetus subsp. testudinum 03-427]EAI4321837.1 single-stranded DNA-binding protein [Campylobacter fetus]EAI4390877.1 single-stranded DNA-binding protein [Campylobacter fetus]OCS06923.1 single-stranded DNA-binding protein [Campylobacter fetus subsp. testudinum]OCS08429.1 single-stranded DNA-binding protein [Campylobacter fetus subsp. testudinum]